MGDFRHLGPPRGKVSYTDAGYAAHAAGWETFDFLPPGLGTLDGYSIRVHFVLAPDPLGWPEMFESAVKQADAIAFIADSRRAFMPENLAMIRALDGRIDRTKVPVVFLFNKRDLPDVVPVAELETALGVDGRPSFAGSATEKAGMPLVKAAVKAAILRHQGKPFQ
jgi:hypothetical protein